MPCNEIDEVSIFEPALRESNLIKMRKDDLIQRTVELNVLEGTIDLATLRQVKFEDSQFARLSQNPSGVAFLENRGSSPVLLESTMILD